jgi:2-polyprenyl-3-methyl-5-hydroxy-6-metoxy-1,4-benzoquinol methylase
MRTSDLERYYDLSADSIAEAWYGNDVLMPTLRDFLSLLPEAPAVLDLGCGPGHESGRLHFLGANVTGIDFSGRSIDIARSRNPHCAFRRMDFRCMDRTLGSYHGVLASGSLIHVPSDTLSEVLRGIAALLLGEGVLGAIVLNGEGQIVRRRDVRGETLEWTAYRYSREMFSRICEAAGLSFEREGLLDEGLRARGWRCYMHRKTHTTAGTPP